ncbi:hypothetical protein ACOSQ3_018850 [Xanthoceras sorbifolium]
MRRSWGLIRSKVLLVYYSSKLKNLNKDYTIQVFFLHFWLVGLFVFNGEAGVTFFCFETSSDPMMRVIIQMKLPGACPLCLLYAMLPCLQAWFAFDFHIRSKKLQCIITSVYGSPFVENHF